MEILSRIGLRVRALGLAAVGFVVAVGAGTMRAPVMIGAVLMGVPGAIRRLPGMARAVPGVVRQMPGRARRLWKRRAVVMRQMRDWALDRERWRPKVAGAMAVVLVLATVLNLFEWHHGSVMAAGKGDGLLVYGASGNTTPQYRTYTNSSDGFGSATGTVAGNAPLTTVMRTSPTKSEAVAGYVNSGGTLQVMCFDGTTWTNEWSVSVGGTGTTRRFDIAYETATGDVMVLYSGNVATTNELAYRTKAGTSGCGSGNWSSATNLDPVRTSGTVGWVRLAWDRRAGSNLITAAWIDDNADLSAMQWSGTAWGNEPSAALETSLECLGGTQGNACAASTVPSTEVFDLDYESLSGDVMVVWAYSGGLDGTNGAYYATCTGGTSSCTWGSRTAVAAMLDDATNLDISANPNSDEIVFASIGDAGSDLQINYWSGSAWDSTGAPNKDTSSVTPIAGSKMVSTGWLTASGTTRSIVVYADSTAPTTSISYYIGTAASFSAGTDFAGSPTPGAFRFFDVQMDPTNQDRLMLTYSDAGPAIYSKRLVMTSAAAFTWTNSDGASLGTPGQGIVGDFSFAYWRSPTALDQSAYKWFANADAVTPGSQLANENTAATITSLSTVARLRMGLTNKGTDLAASNKGYKLQYATNTSALSDPWCSTVSPVTCNSSWTKRKRVTFDTSSISTSLSNFPVLVSLNPANFTFANARSDGFDVVFTDSSGTALNFDREKYDGSTTGVFWVKMPTLHAGGSDYIYMYYGNSGASSDPMTSGVQQATWDSNNKMVQHLEESGACAVTFTDSTSNANNGSCTGSPTAATGRFDGGRTTIPGSTSAIQVANSASLNFTGAITISIWAKSNAYAGNPRLVSKGHTQFEFLDNAGVLELDINSTTAVAATSMPTAGTWHHLVATNDVSGGVARLYVDGVKVAENGDQPMATTTTVLDIGTNPNALANTDYWDGILDEARVSDVARSADWIKAEYVVGSGSYTTFGQEDAVGSAGNVWSDVGNPWCSASSPVTCNSSWTKRKRIAIDNSASSSTLSNFPVMVNLTTSNFTFANARSDGFDVVFADSSGNTLNYDREKYDGSASGIFWVSVPSLYATSNNYIYMYYGNSGASSDPVTGTVRNNTWNSNYAGVWHFKESSGTTADATSNANTGTLTNGAAFTTSGKIGNAVSYDGSNDFVNAGSGASLDNLKTSGMTAEAWINPTSLAASTWGQIIDKAQDANPTNGWIFQAVGGSNSLDFDHTGTATVQRESALQTLNTNVWQHVVLVWTGSTSSITIQFYLNGVETGYASTGNNGTTLSDDSARSMSFGCDVIASSPNCFAGKEDEVRVSNTTRSADWIKAEYLTETDAMNTFGAEETSVGTTWIFTNNATPADGAVIASNLLTGATVKESYNESNPTLRNLAAINTGQEAEWDFAMTANNVCNTVYYFRMVGADGSLLGSYSVYPQITVDVEAPVDQVMRHGGWFNNNAKQPYSCTWAGS
jgi:lysozyme family protein